MGFFSWDLCLFYFVYYIYVVSADKLLSFSRALMFLKCHTWSWYLSLCNSFFWNCVQMFLYKTKFVISLLSFYITIGYAGDKNNVKSTAEQNEIKNKIKECVHFSMFHWLFQLCAGKTFFNRLFCLAFIWIHLFFEKRQFSRMKGDPFII